MKKPTCVLRARQSLAAWSLFEYVPTSRRPGTDVRDVVILMDPNPWRARALPQATRARASPWAEVWRQATVPSPRLRGRLSR